MVWGQFQNFEKCFLILCFPFSIFVFLLFTFLQDTDDDGEDCQELPGQQRISEVVSPELHQRLVAHLGWVREEMSSWLTDQQKEVGLNSTFLYSALTAGWDKKKPLWLRKELNFNLSFIVGNIE